MAYQRDKELNLDEVKDNLDTANDYSDDGIELMVEYVKTNMIPTALSQRLKAYSDQNNGKLNLNDTEIRNTLKLTVTAVNQTLEKGNQRGRDDDKWLPKATVDSFLNLATSPMMNQYIAASDPNDPDLRDFKNNIDQTLHQEFLLLRYHDFTGSSYAALRKSQGTYGTGLEVGGLVKPLLQDPTQEGTRPPSGADQIASTMRAEDGGGSLIGLTDLTADLDATEYYRKVGDAIQLTKVGGDLAYVINTEGLAPFDEETQSWLEEAVNRFNNNEGTTRLNRLVSAFATAHQISHAKALDNILELDAYDPILKRAE